jgi:hypothetical protein
MRAAQLLNGVVINYAEVTEFDGVEYIDPTGSVLGSTWSELTFKSPPTQPQIIPTVTAYQFEIEMEAQGFYAPLMTYVNARSGILQIKFRRMVNVDPTDADVLACAAALGLTSAQVTAIFIAASQLPPMP